MLKWRPHSKYLLAILTAMFGGVALTGAIVYGYDTGAIHPYAWLYWKHNVIKGFTENPGYLFLTLHTILFGIATVYVVKIYRLLKKGWDIRLWHSRR